jgi:hypothetical protein
MKNNKIIKIIVIFLLILFMQFNIVSAAKILGISGTLSGAGTANAEVNIYAYNAGTMVLDQSASISADALGQYATVLAISDALSNVDVYVFANNTIMGVESTGSGTDLNVAVPAAISIDFGMTTPLTLLTPTNQSQITNTTPYFSWFGFNNASYTFNLQIDNDGGFAPAIYRTISNINDLNYALNSSETLADDTYYWRINEYIDAVYSRTSVIGWFDLDSTPPTINSYNPINNSWTSTSPTNVNIVTNENSICNYDTNPGVAFGAKASNTAGATTAHTATFVLTSQGNNLFYVQCQDTIGNTMNISDEETFYLQYDNVAPSAGNVLIEGGNIYHSSTTVNFVYNNFNDSTSGINTYYYNFINNEGTNTGTNDAASPGVLSGAAQGSNTIYVWAEDNVGNIGLATSDSIIVDTAQPVLYDWTQSPADIDESTSGGATITVRVNDTTWNNSNPLQLRYQYNSFGYSAWFNMNLVAGNQYSYVIPEPGSTWSAFLGDFLHYQVQGVDMVGLSTTTTISEFIDVFNNAPVFSNIPFQLAYEDENLSISLSATDADGDALTFSSNFNFTIVSTSNTTAIAWWVPTGDDVGVNQVNFTVSDPYTSNSQIVNVQVSSGNDAPVLSTIGDLFAYEHIPFTKYIYGSDPDNENNYTLDNDLLIFDILEPLRWFRINSFFNATNASYYGVINFTPLLSHRGEHNITLYVEDCNMLGCKEKDTENILFTVGYCGDEDSGGEPWCDEEYESCISCPKDCGKCSSEEDEFMAIIIDPRNCLNKNFTIWTYMLYDRASCENEGLIVQDREVCGNLSGVKVDIMLLENSQWVKVDEFISDDNGEITFSTTIKGEYKLIATKSSYPTSYEYLEIGPCHKEDIEEEIDIAVNQSEKLPIEDKPTTTIPPDETKPTTEIIPEASTFSVILWYVIIPTLLIITMVLGYYYYDKNKNKVAWLLKMRIWIRTKTKILEKKFKKQFKKIKKYLRYDK